MRLLEGDRRFAYISDISTEGETTIIRAFDRETDEDVAIKIPNEGCDQTAFEEQTLLTLNHESIIELRDSIPTDNGPAIVLPFAYGGDLFNAVVARGSLLEQDAKVIAFKLLKAFKYCHDMKTWHRDIKLENIYIMSEDIRDVVLADFGFALDMSKGEFDERFLGSPNYAAPEIWEEQYYSEKVDIWSLGVTLFGAVAGELPYTLIDEFSPLYCIESGIAHLVNHRGLAHLSLECRDLIWRMLQVEPDLRLSAEEALDHVWFADLQGEEAKKGDDED
jgi:serine/threonine protein kinase